MKTNLLPILVAVILLNGCVNQVEQVEVTTSMTTSAPQSTTTLSAIPSTSTTVRSAEVTTTTTQPIVTTTRVTTTTINPMMIDYVDRGYRELTLKVHLFCKTCGPVVSQRLRKNRGVVKYFTEPKNIWRILYNTTKTNLDYIVHHIAGYDYTIIDDKEI